MVRKIRAKLVPRLRAEGFSGRQIAAQDMSRHSVAAVLEAADREGGGSTMSPISTRQLCMPGFVPSGAPRPADGRDLALMPSSDRRGCWS